MVKCSLHLVNIPSISVAEAGLYSAGLPGAEKWGVLMKAVLALFLSLCILFSFSPACVAEGENYDTLADWNVRIHVPDGMTAILEGNEYYIYAQQAGSIPYVMLRTYRAEDAAAFLDEFTAYMQSTYPDLRVVSAAHGVSVGEKECLEIDYSYKVSGYDVRDRRIVLMSDGMAYLFTSKEVEELGMTVGSLLEDVVAECEFVSGTGSQQVLGFSAGYLYCENNGMPRYWLDLSGIIDDNLVLHCIAPSGEAYSENCFVLDLSSAEVAGNGLRIRNIRSLQDDESAVAFGNLTLQFYLDGAVMAVEQEGETPEGVPGGFIPAGSYVMIPSGAAAGPGEKQSHPRPLEDGPYTPEELAAWARIYYFRTAGSFLPEVNVTEPADGMYTVTLSAVSGQAGPVSYTVDAYGDGQDDTSGDAVSLMR